MKGIEPMSSRLNLNDNVSDAFQFTIGGLDYDLKYPTLEELEPIQALNKERAELGEGADTSAIDKKLEETFYSLIIPVGHDTPIQDVLKKQPFPVVKNFNDMVSKQLSAE